MDIKTARRIRTAGWIAFLAYCLLMTYFLFFAERYGRTAVREVMHINLRPLQEIKRCIFRGNQLGTRYVLLNLVGNVLIFIPFGMIQPVLLRSVRNFWRMLLLTAVTSLMIELLQLVLRAGSFDVDDIILNTIGGAAGYCIFAVCNWIRRKIYEQ